MPKQQTDFLLQLVDSLEKAEKRFFKVFVKRNSASDDVLFLQLFDYIDKAKQYDEEQVLKKIPGIKKSQLSNLKAHLYKQLLLSLRLYHRNQNLEIELGERIDYARVLYDKGLYKQCLDILLKIKQKAYQFDKSALLLEIVDFEKLIESQYITHSKENRADALAHESIQLAQKILLTQRLSNLSLLLYGLYLKVGYVRNENDYYYVQEFFKTNLPDVDPDNLDFYDKLYYYQSYVWNYFMSQDFLYYYRYSQKWVDLFHEFPERQKSDMPLYIKGLNNLLNAHFLTGQYDRLNNSLDELEQLAASDSLDMNTEGLIVLFSYIHRINRHYMDGTFSEGLNFVPTLLELIETNNYHWDQHRIMVFYYKIACLYFGSGDFGHTITYLNKIINQVNPNFREDIQCFARILSLIAHFELGNNQLIEYQVKSVYRFLIRMQDMHKVQKEILGFIRSLTRIVPSELPIAMKKLKSKLKVLETDRFERRPFLYLDIISWLESKNENIPVQDIIRRKFLANNPQYQNGTYTSRSTLP